MLSAPYHQAHIQIIEESTGVRLFSNRFVAGFLRRLCIAILKKPISEFSTAPLDNEPRMFAIIESWSEERLGSWLGRQREGEMCAYGVPTFWLERT